MHRVLALAAITEALTGLMLMLMLMLITGAFTFTFTFTSTLFCTHT